MFNSILKASSMMSAIMLLTNCATSDVVQIGENHIIFKEGGTPVLGQEFRLSRLKAEALTEGNEKCEALKKTFKLIREEQTEMSIGVFARYELEFTCV